MTNNFFEFINLNTGEELKEKVLENVKSSIVFKGSNIWILACAIVIASVGLNVNSTAVIIGAMLISPLMSPIVGAGFALAIYDFELLKKSGRNLLIATVVSLVVATLYFMASPFKDAQSELLARTSPNIYDVLIAFFGGLVGVIAITRVEKGNPIPGVAIATALMPPLCTAGYGLAIGNFGYFFGAFYLYCINCFFICTATFFIIKYLKYPPVRWVNLKYEKQIKYGISGLVLIMIVPSFYLAYDLFNQKKYAHNVELFLDETFTQKGYTLIYKRTEYQSKPRKIEVAFLDKKFKPAEIKAFNQDLKKFGITNTQLKIKQDAVDLKSEIAFLSKKFKPAEIALFSKELKRFGLTNTQLKIKQDAIDLKSEILNEIGNEANNISEKDILIKNLKRELESYRFEDTRIEKEIKILFPEILTIALGKVQEFEANGEKKPILVVFYQIDRKSKIDKTKLELWLKEKLSSKDVKIIENKINTDTKT